MSYTGDGETSAIVLPKDGVETLQIRTTTATFIAPGSVTAGRFGLYRWDMAAVGGGATPHFHRTFSESFFVLSGEVTLFDGRMWTPRREGDFVYVPDGGIHGFRNESNAPASMLILFAPGAPREMYFRELGAIFAAGRTLSPQEWVEFWEAHDQFPVEHQDPIPAPPA